MRTFILFYMVTMPTYIFSYISYIFLTYLLPVSSLPFHFVGDLLCCGFPGGSGGKSCSAGDPGSIPGLGRSPVEGNGNPLQYPCLENPMERGAW